MVDGIGDPDFVAKVDAAWGDPESTEAAGLHWGRLADIRRMMNRHVTGDGDRHPLEWFIGRVVREQALPLERVLVLACGGGALERMLLARGWVRNVVAIDLSPSALAAARAVAEAEGLDSIDYRQDDMDDLSVEGPFDAVFSVSAIHHCAGLESLFERLKRVLKPNGWFYVDEYVGPDRFQWSDRQVLAVNRLLDILPDRFVHNRPGYSRRGFARITAEDVAAYDPSEAVRSTEIRPLLHDAFEVEAWCPYGGGLLQLGLANLAQNFDPGISGDPSALGYLKLAIEASDQARRTGRIEDDFAVAIARHPERDR